MHMCPREVARDESEYKYLDVTRGPATIPRRTAAEEQRQRERYEVTQADRDWWEAEGRELWFGETAERNQVEYQRSISIRPDRQFTAHLSCVTDYAAIATEPRISWPSWNLSEAEARMIAKYQAFQLANSDRFFFRDVGCATKVNFEERRTATRYVFPLDILPTLCRGKVWEQLLFQTLPENPARQIFERIEILAPGCAYIHVDEFQLPDDFPFFPERAQ